ncbi:MAG: alpha/beta hydrolase [Polyangiales bacterium]
MRRLPFALIALAIGCSSSSTPPPATTDAGDVETAPQQITMPTGDPLTWAVDKVGPFNVGHRALETSYTPPGQTTARTIPVEIWYPTLDAEGDNPKYLMLFTDTDVFENASIAPPIDPKGYPVHVYSHGSSGFPGTSSEMAHYFASHGWVYVAPAHVGNTLGSPEGKDRPLALYYERATDITAALDLMEKNPPTELAGKLRTNRVLLSGHSFGGYTSWIVGGSPYDTAAIKTMCDSGAFTVACKPEELAVFAKDLHDPRVVAVIPMAGSDFDWIADFDGPKKPYLVMSGSEDVSPQPAWDKSMSLDFTWIEFQGGCHQLFAMGGCGKFPEKDGWALTNTWALVFGRRYVLGDSTDRTTKIFTNAESLSDRIVYKHKGAATPPTGF